MFKEITYLTKVTNECNLRCEYCFTELNTDVMPISTVKTLIEKSRGFKSVELVIMGGEPLMVGLDYLRELREYVDCHMYETKQFINMTLVTNGMMLEDEHFDMFSQISVSYDGHKLGQKGNGHIRRKIKKYAKKITVTVIVNKNNYQHLQSIYDELEEFGVRRMCVNFDAYASKHELMMFKRAIEAVDYRRKRTRITIIDAIDAITKAGHYGFNNDMVLGIANFGSIFGVEPSGDMRTSLLKEADVYGNINTINHVFDLFQSPCFIKDAHKYISEVSNDLIQGSFLDNAIRDNSDFRDVLNNKEALIC